MMDPRVEKLADLLINYSCDLKSGEHILIEAIDVPHMFTKELVRRAQAAGGRPVVLLKSNEVNRALMVEGSREQWDLIAEVERHQMEKVQCYIGARGSANVSELSDVPSDRQRLYEASVWKRVHQEVRIRQTRWCVLRWPHPSMAQ